MDDNCYWCRKGNFSMCLWLEGIRLKADLKTIRVMETRFEDAWDRWSSYGYIYVNPAYGTYGSFIGGSLGKSADVPNN